METPEIQENHKIDPRILDDFTAESILAGTRARIGPGKELVLITRIENMNVLTCFEIREYDLNGTCVKHPTTRLLERAVDKYNQL